MDAAAIKAERARLVALLDTLKDDYLICRVIRKTNRTTKDPYYVISIFKHNRPPLSLEQADYDRLYGLIAELGLTIPIKILGYHE
jgi:hypothetical protein